MWGQCHGLTLLSPRQVAVGSLDEVFACFGMPQIMFRPVKLSMLPSSLALSHQMTIIPLESQFS